MSNDREAVLLALEEAAQEIADKMALLREVLREDALAEMQALTESEYREDALVRLSETHQQLDAALGETEPVALYVRDDEYEYSMWGHLELIGRILGTYGGRLVFIPDNRATAWPDGTAVYVRRVKG